MYDKVDLETAYFTDVKIDSVLLAAETNKLMLKIDQKYGTND